MAMINRNRIPGKVRRVHLIAVCGTAMGALAVMMKRSGLQVSGSDSNVYPPMSTFLEDHGIRILEGYAPEHLSGDIDLVVVGNAVSADNAEVLRMDALGLSYCSLPQALNRFLVRDTGRLVVTGTHGKTTTSSLMAWMLHVAGLHPSFMIGGILADFDSNHRLSDGPYTVLEGDEYDTAFFDKGPKFNHFTPYAAVLTSVEFDHADIYSDLDHVCRAFAAFVGGIPEDRLLVACTGDENVDRVLADAVCRVERYGTSPEAHWQLSDVTVTPPWTTFRVTRHRQPFGEFRTRMMGRHNLLNAISVIAVGAYLDIGTADIAEALETFSGVRRRQEVRGVKNGVTVMDDFAHHPTAVHATLEAVRPHFPDGRVVAVFEPRTNSSMRQVFQQVYPEAFDMADIVCIREPSMLSKIPEEERMSSRRLVSDIRGRNRTALHFTSTEDIIDYLASECRSGDLVLVMSNGGFDSIHSRLLEAL